MQRNDHDYQIISELLEQAEKRLHNEEEEEENEHHSISSLLTTPDEKIYDTLPPELQPGGKSTIKMKLDKQADDRVKRLSQLKDSAHLPLKQRANTYPNLFHHTPPDPGDLRAGKHPAPTLHTPRINQGALDKAKHKRPSQKRK